MKKIILSIVMILAGTVLSGGAYGATLTGTLDVSVTAVPACTMSVTGITFPDYVGLQVTGNGDVTVTCAQTIPYNIALDGGLHFAGGTRLVTNIANNYIYYTLFQDAGFNVLWGDSDFAATYPNGTSLPDTGTGVATPHTVYGVLSAGGAGPPGLYTDTVTVTLYY
jgi:spore coat protein U-like protein